MKRILSMILVLCLFACAAQAENEKAERVRSILNKYTVDTIQLDWSETGLDPASGVPVLGAPFGDAWQEGMIRYGEDVLLLDTAGQGEWGMIAWEDEGGAGHIGWIRFPSPIDTWQELFPADAWPVRITRGLPLTDDPFGAQRTVVTLRPGDTATGLLCVNGWDAVQTRVDGKTAWLFGVPGALEAIPQYHLEGNTLVIHEGVTRIGFSEICGPLDWETGLNPRTPMPLDENDVNAGTFDFGMDYILGQQIRHIRFPSTLRFIGESAFVYGEVNEFRIPEGLEALSADAEYGMKIGRLVIPPNVGEEVVSAFGRSVGAYEAAPGHPTLKTVDGVLFTADGRRLIAYPSEKTDEHYDVPAGTKTIGESAFINKYLKSVSLPMGLERIKAYGMASLTRLQSLTVPLTVTELDPTAFCECLSLERLSLPPALAETCYLEYVEQTDLSVFSGDNGMSQSDRQSYWRTQYALIDTPDGTGAVPCYKESGAQEPFAYFTAGTPASTGMIIDGNLMEVTLYDPGNIWKSVECWVDPASLTPDSGDCLFTVTAASVPPELEGEGWTFMWMSHRRAEFQRGDADAEDIEYLYLLPGKAVLRRERTGDSRILGCLVQDGNEPVRLLDAPAGSETLHCFTGEQAEVLEARGGWLRVRIARGAGWIPAERFLEVPQETPDEGGIP